MTTLLWILLIVIAVAVIATIVRRARPAAAPSTEPPDATDSGRWVRNALAEWPGNDLREHPALGTSGVTITFDRDLSSLHVGDIVTALVSLNGVPAPVATRCQWATSNAGIVDFLQSTTTPGLNKITAKKAGTAQILAYLGPSAYSWPPVTVTVAAAPVPVPPPVLSPAPAAQWPGMFTSLRTLLTDFYYNWQTTMYAVAAKRYDVMIAMKHVAAIKALNPNARNIVYALQYTTLIDPPPAASLASAVHDHFRHGLGLIRHYLRSLRGLEPEVQEGQDERALFLDPPSVETKYLPDFAAWCSAHGISAAAAEAAWLHAPGSTKRIVPYVWSSPRNVLDPRNQVARDYTVDRLTRVASVAGVDGVFLDEFGRGVMEPVWKLATGTDATALAAIESAQLSLLGLVRNALAKTGKQLVVNTASYVTGFDAACADAAGGTHMEQTNNPLQGDLTSSTWAFIDARLANGTVVNMVPPYQYGEYESQVGATGTAHMDTPRGKLLEIASALMVVINPSSLLWLSLENGDWAKYTPVTNWQPQLDAIAKMGLPLERRVATTAPGVGGSPRRAYVRRFEHGLVVFNAIYHDIWNKSSQDYGGDTFTVLLPTDRAYFKVNADGTVASIASTSVVLRTPEAAIFVTHT
jgi:hypothetical protein